MNHSIDKFINSKLAAGRQNSTIIFYKIILYKFAPFVSEWPPTPADIEKFLLHKRQTCNDVSISTTFTAISSYLNWCERHRLLDDNPLRHIDAPKRPQSLPKAVSQDNIKRLFVMLTKTAARGDHCAIRDLAMLRLAYDTGCRATELGRIKLSNLDLNLASARIDNGKGQKDRVVYFGQKTIDAIDAWLLIHPGGEWLFTSRVRTHITPLTRRGVLHIVQKWSGKINLKMTAHQLRHSYATHALRRGISLENIQKQLGHSDIKTTAIYLAIEDEDRRRAHYNLAPGDIV